MRPTDKIWMRKSDAQLGYAFCGCLGWIWFYGEWPDTAVIGSGTPCIFIDDPRESHGVHTKEMFVDLGFAASKSERADFYREDTHE